MPVSNDRGRLARRAIAVLVCVPLLLLAACGGGGGGGGDTLAGGDTTNNPADPGTPDNTPDGAVNGGTLAISTSNSRAVAADALANAVNVDVASTANFATGVQVSEAGAGGGATLQLAASARVLLAKVGAARALATGVVTDFAMDCTSGGTLDFQATQANAEVFVAGDRIVFTANACKETVSGVEYVMSGRLTLTMVSGRVDITEAGAANFPNRFVETLAADNWSSTSRGVTVTSNGELTADVTQHTPESDTVILTGTAFSGTVTSAAGTRSFTFRNFRQVIDFAVSTTTFTASGVLESNNSRLGSGTLSYTVSTPTPFVISGGMRSGVMLVTGNGSALRITVTATDTFLVEVDANGDGSFESSSITTRSELDALL